MNSLELLRGAALYDHAAFSRAAFYWKYKKHKIDSYHDRMISKLIDEILDGKRDRVVVNMPPRHFKTEQFVVMLTARIFAINPAARVMHLSYSQPLVEKNSTKIKDIIKSPQFQRAFPRTIIAKDTERYWTTTAGGEFFASTTNGQVTGFECGMNGDPFDGILIIDDPQKSKGARSPVDRATAKDVTADAISTRLNHERTPVVVVQQRLDSDDISNFLLSGGTGDIWDTLVLQGISEHGRPPLHYYEYSHCNLLNYRRPAGALCPARKSLSALIKIRDAVEDDNEENPRGAQVFATQYQQNPADFSISLFKKIALNGYAMTDIPVTLSEIWWRIDTAQKGKASSDPNAMVLFGRDARDKSKVYILDAMSKRCSFPDLLQWAFDEITYSKIYESQSINLTGVIIEDANIGPALLSSLEVKFKEERVRIGLELTPKYGSKFDRALESVPYWQQGRLVFPNEETQFTRHGLKGINDLRKEYKNFNMADKHASDDLLDCAIWEIVTRFGNAEGETAEYMYGSF